MSQILRSVLSHGSFKVMLYIKLSNGVQFSGKKLRSRLG